MSARERVSRSATNVFERAPFRWTRRDQHALPVRVRGGAPAWLQGQLVRTAPAVFTQGGWQAQHWFDGLALMYSFSFEGDRVRFQQRSLASQAAAEAAVGRNRLGQFGTSMKRGFFERLFHPVPTITDNTNVNVVPWQGAWLAMSEVQYQHVLGADDLATRGVYQYEDDLPRGLLMTAHPHFDFESGALVNVGTLLGPRNKLIVFRQRPDQRQRVIEGELSLPRVPYVHDLGVTARHVVLIDQPLRASGMSMLWRDRGYIDSFAWTPETGTRLWKLDRSSGAWTDYETDALFCFHTVNTFEQGEDVVFDFLAFDDPSLIDKLRCDRLSAGYPSIDPRYVRARLRPGKKRVELEPLSDARFDFPSIPYRREHGRPYHSVWGASLKEDGRGGVTSALLRVNGAASEVRRFAEDAMIYGEPVFVPKPRAARSTEGVLLTVGAHVTEERSTLAVLDAESMEPLAHFDIELALPLGFHGNFRSSGG